MPITYRAMPASGTKRIGIVGAGMAGLYAAYRLQLATDLDLKVHLYELDGRVGGRIKTQRFTAEKNQYFEAGAMRIPDTKMHAPTLELIRSLSHTYNANLKLIPYYLSQPNNRIYINGRLKDGTSTVAAAALGFNLPEPYNNKTAEELLLSVISPFIKQLDDDFEKGWKLLMEYDRTSFRQFLVNAGWPELVIDFVETMSSQTNQFAISFPELIMQNLDFSTNNWWTLEDGMDRFPQALATVVGLKNITFNARVQNIENDNDQVRIVADTPHGRVEALYDKVILAIPPSALRMIPERPRWDPTKEQAIRAMYFEALYKIGMRFKTRFWEKGSAPSFGGQSATDLPIRWIVYPSNGVGTEGPGVLLLYSWMTDAATWSSIPFSERVKSALCHLAKVYEDVDVYDEFIAAEDLAWSEHNPTGDAMFFPGQFSTYFDVARRAEGNIYFAGEHLSRHHTWITGAIDSARSVAEQIITGFTSTPACSGWVSYHGCEPKEDYDPQACRKETIKEGLKKITNNWEAFERAILRSGQANQY